MENSNENKNKLFPGAGYLMGFAMGALTGIVFVAITGVEALIGVISCSVALPAGFLLEKKLVAKDQGYKSSLKNFSIGFLALGIIFFALFYFLVKFN